MKRTAALALVWIAIMIAFVALALFLGEALAGDYALYEAQMRATGIQRMLHADACRTAPEAQRGVCFARVDAEWRKALANAEASYTGKWEESKKVAREADARVRRIEAQK